MKNAYKKLFCGAVASCLLLNQALAAEIRPDKKEVTLGKGENTASFTLSLKNAEAFAGAEFGLKVSSGALDAVPEVEYLGEAGGASQIKTLKDGVFYFGFFNAENEFEAGREYPVARLSYRYSGNASAFVELVHSKIVSVSDNNSTKGDESSSGFSVKISRDTSGGNGNSGGGNGGNIGNGGGSGNSSGSGGGGSSFGGASGSSSGSSGGDRSVVVNPDGSKTEIKTETETTRHADGSVTWVITTTATTSALDGTKTTVVTKSETTARASGKTATATSTEETVEKANGSSGRTRRDASGNLIYAEAVISERAVKEASSASGYVLLPLDLSAEVSAPISVKLPGGAGRVRLSVPAGQLKPGHVAVIVKADGSEEIIKTSVLGEKSVLLTLEGSSTIKIIDNTRSFYDVSPANWFAGAVAWASSRGVMNGVSAHMFSPGETTSRAMMAQIVYNLANADSSDVTAQFSDVNASSWFGKSVTWAVRNGIARSGGSRFGAADALTREDMASFLYNYAKYAGLDTSASGNLSAFGDYEEVSDWAEPAMRWAIGAGLINGTQNGTRIIVLDPKGTATRAQMATILERFCKNVM